MSQQKVEQNKKLQQNRKKIVAREKWIRRLWALLGLVLALLIIGWVAYSIHAKVEANRKANPTTTEVDLSDLMNFNLDNDDSAK